MQEVLRAKAGDKEAMGVVMKRFTGLIAKTARGIYIKGLEFDDLVQIGRLSIIKAVNMFDPSKGKSFTGYVKNAIIKNFYYLIRGTAKTASYCSLNSLNSEGIEIIECLVSEENVEEQIIESEQAAALHRALRELSEKEREIIEWFYIKDKALGQYAEEKGIAYRTAIDRKKRALEKLKNILTGRN
ncbi:sigma-70 family RNA polymerase sigma factor [Clostridium magnum]|uniref:sigma-70 family RNA polymerase sigma factor n=1 Tax=Clostridium magnum TaxID=33954 RepID=UPI00241C9711|nr:sigma-70 family RNA polymerase sigma factor [Clostridium magnum]